ncbi:MAG TPA: tripartite tricarboxylate transporter substrate binding protein [Burkholderiales bacterium]|nr:tripartite tricarboxylate transporter substrate binding protein [Burkholderiales bacterium]
MTASRREFARFAVTLVAASPFATSPSFARRNPPLPIVPFARGGRTGSRRGGWFGGGDGARPPGSWQGALRWLAAALLALASLGASPGFAQKYPTKPIRLIVPFAPGGGTDTLARPIAQRLTQVFGQTVVVDNRPGAGGSVGAEMTVRAEPDGYTIIIVSGSFGANAALHKLPYDSVKDIQPIILVGTTGLLATMHPSAPIKSTSELIAYARANPGKLNFGSAGAGGLGHLALELFKLETKTQITHVPYKGSGPVMTALLAGEVHSSFSSLVPSIPHVKAGRLRPIAITTPRRSTALPEVPTVGETVPGFEVVHWYGIWGPKGLPPAIVKLWNTEVAKFIHTEEMKKQLAAEGLEPAGGPPEQFLERVRSDVEKWKRVVREAGIVVGQ